MAQKKVIQGLLICITLLILALFASADPPWPHGMSGYIFYNSSTQVPIGIPFRINDTTSGFIAESETSNPVPGHTGWYSYVINGTDNDLINFIAWNGTAYGEKNITLSGDMEVNLSLNTTRPAEMNLSIVLPENNALYTLYTDFKLNVSINILGGANATGCNFTIGFNTSVLALDTGESQIHNYSSLSCSLFYEIWNLTAAGVGSSNITINSTCDTDGKNLYGLTSSEASNISVESTAIPIVNIIQPSNNTPQLSNNTITFTYNATDDGAIQNCTLFVNGTYKNHTDSPLNNTVYNLTTTLGNSVYNWTINCSDAESNIGTAGRYNLSVEVYYPHISVLNLSNQVDLLAGSNLELHCNGTVEDGNGYGNIQKINATFYYTEGGHNSTSDDNNNTHYSANCTASGGSGDSTDFDCIFNLTYFADAGEWQCNVSVEDAQAHLNSSADDANVSELYAISIPLELDYGGLSPGQTSSEQAVNIENQGNVKINISILGYGGAENDNLSMVCPMGDISLEYQRYNISTGLGFDQMFNLTADFSKISNFYINKSTGTTSSEDLYWRMRAPTGVRGSCNGTLIFSVVI